MTGWKRIEPTATTKVGWRTITSKTFEMVNGETTTFDTFHKDGQEFACVIALTPEKKVIIAREYCPGPEAYMCELPGGFVDADESPEAAIRREFSEETGYRLGTLRYLGSFCKDKYMNATWHAFYALDCVKDGKQQLEVEEDITVTEMSIDTFIEYAKDGKITDHAAVLMAYDDLLNIKEGK